MIRRSQTTEAATHIGTMELAGDRQPRYGEKTACVPVGLGPSHATRACERVSLAIVRTPGPVSQDRLILTCLRLGDHKLQKRQHTSGRWSSRGTGNRATGKRRYFTVGRGPVPRHRSRHPTRAGETRSDARVASEAPRATMKKTPSPHRRARACPSPSSVQSNTRG